jgi:CopG family nickel-responsive transcriptional regulator
MSHVTRFSVSLEPELLEQFDTYCRESRFATRSEAVRQMVRETLTSRAMASGKEEVSATLTLVYDHHKPGLTDKLLKAQHDHEGMVVATTHVHIDHHTCLEVIVLRGKAAELQRLADGLRGLKGIHKGQLVLAAAGHSHPHRH